MIWKALGVTLIALLMLRLAAAVYLGARDGLVRRSIMPAGSGARGGPALTGRRAAAYGAYAVVAGCLGLALCAWALRALLRS